MTNEQLWACLWVVGAFVAMPVFFALLYKWIELVANFFKVVL